MCILLFVDTATIASQLEAETEPGEESVDISGRVQPPVVGHQVHTMSTRVHQLRRLRQARRRRAHRQRARRGRRQLHGDLGLDAHPSVDLRVGAQDGEDDLYNPDAANGANSMNAAVKEIMENPKR